MASVNMHPRQFVFLFDAILATSFAVRAFAQAAEEQAVLAQIQAMFDGMSKRDAAAIKAPALQEGTMVLMRDGKPTQMTFDVFPDRAGKPGEPRSKNVFTIHSCGIDNDLAVVSAPFDFLVDGEIDHCGTVLFTLLRQSLPERAGITFFTLR